MGGKTFMDILEFYHADTLWPYVIGEKDIARNDGYIEFYRAAREFGKLCALTSLQKASSNPYHREIDDEFVDIYNGITKAILASIEIGQKEQSEKLSISMSKLRILAEYMGPDTTHVDSYKQGLDVVLKGDIRNVYVPDTNVVEETYRMKVVSNFASGLLSICSHYGWDSTKKITENVSCMKKVVELNR